MEYTNLWDVPSEEESLSLTENIKEILKQQSQYLKEATKGKVFGKFRQIKQANVMSAMGTLVLALSKGQEQPDDDTGNLKNANELYSDQRYCYEIYNKEYKFRPFEMTLSPVYPISIIVDEGIWEDCSKALLSVASGNTTSNNIEVDSDDMFIEALQVIFTSKKVRFILLRLQQLSKED